MKLNDEKVDESALALQWFTLHDGRSVWKSIDWGTMDRFYQKGFISNPASRNKPVLLTDEGW